MKKMAELIVLGLFMVAIGGIFAADKLAKDKAKGFKRRSRDYLIEAVKWPSRIITDRNLP